MTASLPFPQDADPDEPDGVRGSARGAGTSVRPLPPKPDTPADLAAAQPPPAKKPARRPSKKSPRKKPAAADPGPPPPLPPDLLIPPKPPLPSAAEQDADAAEVPLTVEPAVAEDAKPGVAEGTDAVVVAQDEPPVVADTEPEDAVAVEPAPAQDSDPRPEAVVTTASEPAAVVDPEPAAAAAEPDSAAVVSAAALGPEQTSDPATAIDDDAATLEDLEQAFADDPAPVAEPFIFAGRSVSESVDPASAALVVKGVTKAFGETRAVDGIDLTVPTGIFYGLVGPNGAGKTTTLSMIAGLLRPDRGTIRVNGIDAKTDPTGAKRQMGVLPDRLRTFDRLTGRQLLHYYGVLRGLPSAVVESRTADLARAFDLSDALGRVVSDYSAGMVKKVMLAGAMIHSPRLLVLDEPFEAVDPVSSAIILDILSTYVAHGGTVILSSHGMDLVQRVCSRVAVIVAGQVLAEGTVDEVRGELTLEQRFIELAGGLSDVEGLEWLHTFSD